MNRKNTLWRLCCGIAILLSALAFSPLVLTPGVSAPELLGVPRTLWLGILIAFALVLLTAIGGVVHPANDVEGDEGDDEC